MRDDEDDESKEAARYRQEVEALGQQRLFGAGEIRQRLSRYRCPQGCTCEDCTTGKGAGMKGSELVSMGVPQSALPEG